MEFVRILFYGLICVGLGYFVCYRRTRDITDKAREKLREAEEVLKRTEEMERAYEEMDLYEDLEE